jgi:branched-chain amino acid transport system permease protein
MKFFLEVLFGGVFSGLMYALVALGFVLIYRASSVFNFAQGAMVLFSALTFVSLVERGVPLWLALLSTAALMVVLALLIEALVLRHLIERPIITLFMATLGVSFVLEGLAQLVWGAQVHGLELGIADRPLEVFGIELSTFDLFAAFVAGALVLVLSLLFGKTRIGLALRAVADDALAARAIGISIERVWAIVWMVAGLVALVTGLLWGARVGVQFSLSLVVLKALPVLILGGFGSVSGALAAGILVGASEKLAEVYVGSRIGGGIESWFPYALALLLLLVRPSGLFGQARVERI